MVASATADQAGEAAIATSCGTQGSAHRFAVQLPSDVRAAFAGQTIFVHGISAVGRSNLLIGNGGTFRVPSNPVVKPVVDPVVQTDKQPDPPDVSSLARETIYRLFYSDGAFGDHLMTLVSSEGTPAYRLDGAAFNAIARGVVDSRVRPIFRCLLGVNSHYVSTDPACEGFQNEGVLGQLLISPAPGASAVYRYYNPTSGDHLATTNQAEAIANGFSFEYVLGYAY